MKIGDEVHYKSSFLSSIGAAQFAEVANRVGIVEKFIANGKYARIAWDDEGASTVLVANLAKTKSSVPSTGMQYQEELRVQRALLNIDAAITVRQTWAQLTD
jgi:hypothetical protein